MAGDEAERGDATEARLARLEAQNAKLIDAVELLSRHATARNWDAVAALIASAIGVIAVVVAGYTAQLQRTQLRAQVWPRLQLEMSTGNPSFFVINQGTGPAIVTGMRVTFDGKVMHSLDSVRKAAGFVDGDGVAQSSLSANVLPAGKKLVYLQPWAEADHARFLQLLLDDPQRLVTTLCYCSVLDECWQIDSLSTTPVSIETCPIAEAERYHD